MGTVNIGGVSYEIYGDEAGAKTYFNAALGTAGTAYLGANSTVQKQSLVTASRMFDRTSWVGALTDPATPQPLAWPRTGVSDREGNAVDPNTIPMDIIDGSYELAGALLVPANTIQAVPSAGSNLKKDRLLERVEGAVTTETEKEYFRPTIGIAGRWPTPVQELIGWALAGSGLPVAAVNGACDDSTFADTNWGFNSWGLP